MRRASDQIGSLFHQTADVITRTRAAHLRAVMLRLPIRTQVPN